jgi:hypothetical protein
MAGSGEFDLRKQRLAVKSCFSYSAGNREKLTANGAEEGSCGL